jgi:hypothetical protein
LADPRSYLPFVAFDDLFLFIVEDELCLLGVTTLLLVVPDLLLFDWLCLIDVGLSEVWLDLALDSLEVLLLDA